MAKPADTRDRGTAAQTGTGDLAIFGAVPAAFAPTPASADISKIHWGQTVSNVSTSTAADIQSTSHTIAFSEAPTTVPGTDVLATVPVGTALTATIAPIAMAGGTVTASPHGSTGIAPFVPMPHGSGGIGDQEVVHTPSVPDAATVGATNPSIAVAAATTLPSAGITEIGIIRDSVAALQDALAALSERLPASDVEPDSIVAHAETVVATATGTVAMLEEHIGTLGEALADATHDVTTDIAGTVSTLADQAEAAVASTVHTITNTVTPVVGGITTLIQNTTDAVGETTEQTIGSVTATVIDAEHGVASIADPVVGAVSDTVAATSEHIAPVAKDTIAVLHDVVAPTLDITDHALVSGTVPAATDAVSAVLDAGTDHFGGSDPTGGIHTLVGMVAAADAFDLHTGPIVGEEVLAPALGAFGAIDVLADAGPVDSLLGLGSHHDDGGLLGGDHGLFGHG